MSHMTGSRAVGGGLDFTTNKPQAVIQSGVDFLSVCTVAPNGSTVLCSGKADGRSRRTQNVAIGALVISRPASEKVAALSHFPSYCFCVLPGAENAVENDSNYNYDRAFSITCYNSLNNFM